MCGLDCFFFLILGMIFYFLDLPFDYYHTFVLEEKYGFNRSDLKTWIFDNLKSGLLSVGFLFLIMGPFLWAIEVFSNYWWLWGFVIVSVIQFVIVILYPVLIAPLFNKFEPLQDKDLASKVEELANRVGMKNQWHLSNGRRPPKHTFKCLFHWNWKNKKNSSL